MQATPRVVIEGPGTVAPGSASSATVVITNVSDVVDRFTVDVVGDLAEWCAVSPTVASLFPGEAGTVTVTFFIPTGAHLPAGTHHAAIRVVPASAPAAAVVEEFSVEVTGLAALTTEIRPQTGRGRGGARYVVTVHNSGNVPVTADLRASEPDDVMRLELKHGRLALAPGDSQRSKLKLTLVGSGRRTAGELLPFTVDAVTPGATSSTTGYFRPDPRRAPALLPLVVTLLALGMLGIVVIVAARDEGGVRTTAGDAKATGTTGRAVTVPFTTTGTDPGAQESTSTVVVSSSDPGETTVSPTSPTPTTVSPPRTAPSVAPPPTTPSATTVAPTSTTVKPVDQLLLYARGTPGGSFFRYGRSDLALTASGLGQWTGTGWRQVVPIDTDGNGRDEVLFYSSGPSAFVYDLNSDGTIANKRTYDIGTGWSSIAAFDTGDGKRGAVALVHGTTFERRLVRLTGAAGAETVTKVCGKLGWDRAWLLAATNLNSTARDEIVIYNPETGRWHFYELRDTCDTGSADKSGYVDAGLTGIVALPRAAQPTLLFLTADGRGLREYDLLAAPSDVTSKAVRSAALSKAWTNVAVAAR